MLFGRKKPGFVEEEAVDTQEQPAQQDLLDFMESLPDADDSEFGDVEMSEEMNEVPELTKAQHLAEYIRLRTKGIQLTSESQLNAEVEHFAQRRKEWELDESCQDIVYAKGNQDIYFYSKEHMSDNYAMIAALVEEKDLARTIAEMVRFNCRTYPVPTPYTYFERTPYSSSRAQIDRAAAVLESKEDCQDIKTITNNLGELFLFSTDHMSERYAKALANVDEYTD